MVQMFFSLVMIGVAIAFGVEAAAYGATAARTPYLLAWVVGLLAAAMFVEAVLDHRKGRAALRDAPADVAAAPVHATDAPAGGSVPRALLFLALVVAYTLSFRWAGFVLASVVFLGGSMLAFRATRPLLVLVTVVAAIVTIYAVFVAFLRLPVPLWPAF